MQSPFQGVFPENKGFFQKLAIVIFMVSFYFGKKAVDICGWGACHYSIEDELLEQYSSNMTIVIVLFFTSIIIFLYGHYRDKADPYSRLCSNCNKVVSISEFSISFEVLGVSDTIQPITSNNAVTGVTYSDGKFSPTLGNIQSTSYVPIKMGRVRITTFCPSCQSRYYWIEDRQVNQWTDPNGSISYEVLGDTIIP